MERKGVVSHRTSGRQFLYRARISEEDVRRSMVGELTRRLFRGDAAALVSHLLEEEEIDPAELQRLKSLIAEKTSAGADRAGKDRRRGR